MSLAISAVRRSVAVFVMNASLLLASAAAAPGIALAQTARERLLVSVEWLAEHLDDPDLVLLHVGAREDYDAEHIANARYVERDRIAERVSEPSGLILEVPSFDALEVYLESLGVSDDSRLVVYWGSEWVTPAARVVFTLDLVGLGDRTVLLDGGLAAWKVAGHPVTAETRTTSVGTLMLRPRPEMIVDAEWVSQHANEAGYSLVDGRARAFFDGVREDRGKAGHIPGAGSIPWTELIDESLRLKDPEALTALFDAAGVQRGNTVVGYCHIGQYATLVLFAARTLGYDVLLYDGAFQDWARRGLPLQAGSAGGGS